MKSNPGFYRNFNLKKAVKLIRQSLKEDIGKGDVTSELLISKDSVSNAEIIVKENGIAAGLNIFCMVFHLTDKNVKAGFNLKEGDRFRKNTVIGYVKGKTTSLLKCERVALNILQRMCGIATNADRMVRLLNNEKIKIIDTRKTTPNFRLFEKLAVKIGGAENHRSGLYDMVLIKDNHIEACGGIENTLRMIDKSDKFKNLKKEIEVKNLKELETVLNSGTKKIHRIMLDNFSLKDVISAAEMNQGRYEIEVSGGINESNIRNYRKLSGINYISMGSLTHSSKSLDISFNFIT
ncbi:MAG TPA: carboxylating nicotinate-nucleotide diphosphorylase [Ignavibacteria bacterium]|nr:carboxylating nicotinate-nucleotide diphosphorylase [Bacteroidota bacterium]HRI84822.1 carboxylating nicotinate-nucleotide diphosphorylase [Ignavibacteria bacterium]HRK00532.1 carboxylating nicotinate-nucleotide diphosphorylase [Ignavibacteria bacterium]